MKPQSNVIGVRGGVAELTESAAAGVVVEPEDAPALANAIFDIARRSPNELASMGACGRSFYQRAS